MSTRNKWAGYEATKARKQWKRVVDAGGVVFVTDSIEEAKGYGSVVFEIELLNESPVFFQDAPYSNAKEYYIPVAVIQEDGIYNRVS